MVLLDGQLKCCQSNHKISCQLFILIKIKN
jgi:hypothetical protein